MWVKNKVFDETFQNIIDFKTLYVFEYDIGEVICTQIHSQEPLNKRIEYILHCISFCFH